MKIVVVSVVVATMAAEGTVGAAKVAKVAAEEVAAMETTVALAGMMAIAMAAI